MSPATHHAAIRAATPADSAKILEIYAPIIRDTPISFEMEPPSEAEMAARITEYIEKHPWLVLDVGGAVAGYAYGSVHRKRAAYQWSVEVSAYVHPDYQRKGVARGLYAALFDLLVMGGYYSAFAGITLPNAASVGFHEALGFTPVGVFHDIGHKFGQWWDVGWWERPLQPRGDTPQPPRLWPTFDPSDSAVQQALQAGLALMDL